jgi:hypothetical protein
MRFGLAFGLRWLLLSLRIMRFGFGKCAAIVGVASVLLFCSCEKHHVGEIPEVQKEHVDPAKAAPEHQAQPAETASESR